MKISPKKWTLWLLALALLSGGALRAQDITGAWQGTLQVGPGLRMVIKVSQADGGALKAVMYSIDQGGQPIPASAIALKGSTVTMTINAIGGTFEGKLNAAGDAIAGTWSQGGRPLPLNLVRATGQTAWTIPEPPARLKPMAPDASPAFDVDTVKPSDPDERGKGFRVNGRNFSTINTSVSDLVAWAYGLQARQITGGPDWLANQHYDLAGKPDGEGEPSLVQWKGMVQKLLADRFQLKFHRDKKSLPVYAVVVAKTGSKLTKSSGDPSGLPSLNFQRLGALLVRNATIADFAGVMQSAVLDRPVVDQTGLPGKYDFTLTWTPDETQFSGLGVRVPPPADNAAAPPDLFTAIQEQLGLKLESTRALADILVIDHVEKPSPN